MKDKIAVKNHTLFLVISISPCLDNSETLTIDLSLSTAFLTSSYTNLLFAIGQDRTGKELITDIIWINKK